MYLIMVLKKYLIFKFLTQYSVNFLNDISFSFVITLSITVIGWFIVYNLNKRNVIEEKKIILVMDSYEQINNRLTDIINSIKKLHKLINDILDPLRFCNPEEFEVIFYKSYIKKLKDNTFIVKYKAISRKIDFSFNNFRTYWAKYNFIYSKYNDYAYALEYDKEKIIADIWGIISDLIIFANTINNPIDIIENKEKFEIIKNLENSEHNIVQLLLYLDEFNSKLQHFVYIDIFKSLKIKFKPITYSIPNKFKSLEHLLDEVEKEINKSTKK